MFFSNKERQDIEKRLGVLEHSYTELDDKAYRLAFDWRSCALGLLERYRTGDQPHAYTITLPDKRFQLLQLGTEIFLVSFSRQFGKVLASIQQTTWEEWATLVDEMKAQITAPKAVPTQTKTDEVSNESAA